MLLLLIHSFIRGFVALYLLHVFLTHVIHRVFPTLTYIQSHIIGTKCVSGIQAVAVSLLAIRTMWITQDIMHDGDPILESYILNMSSYFIYDLLVMYNGFVLQNAENCFKMTFGQRLFYFVEENTLITFHHIAFELFGIPIVFTFRNGLGMFFLAGFIMAEISTPFLSVRSIMKLLSLQSSAIYDVNGLLFLTTFFLGRLCMVPYMYYRYSAYKNISLLQVPYTVPFYCNICSCLYYAMQVNWWYTAIRSALRHAKRKKNSNNI